MALSRTSARSATPYASSSSPLTQYSTHGRKETSKDWISCWSLIVKINRAKNTPVVRCCQGHDQSNILKWLDTGQCVMQVNVSRLTKTLCTGFMASSLESHLDDIENKKE